MFRFFISFTLLATLAECERLNQDIYTPFSDIKACFRRLNGTQEFGCTSNFRGNVGVLQYVDNKDDISAILNNEFGPYVVLVSPDIFSGSLLEKLKNTGNVNGVILPGIKEGKWKDKIPRAQSDDIPCPNQDSSLYSDLESRCGSTQRPWNPDGENLLWKNWDFPIFLINDGNTTAKLYDCYAEHNTGPEATTWPLCSVELKSPMYAAKDSETCYRRSNIIVSIEPQDYCEPLSDYNLYYFQTPRNGTQPDGRSFVQKEKSVAVVLARMDALNIFDKEEVGFDSPTTGIVTLIATAQAIKKALIRSYKPDYENIMFMLVHGESLDYIGSNRIVYDMMQEDFPMKLSKDLQSNGILKNGTQALFNLSNIKYIVELGQLANTQSSEMYYHAHNTNEDIIGIINRLSASPLDIKKSTRTLLPPSSSHTFLKKMPDIPILFISNFDQQYSNVYFHSIYDNALVHNYKYSAGENQRIVQHLTQIATALADALVFAAAADTQSTPKADPGIINSMLECFAETRNCSLYRDVGRPRNFPYVGIVSDEPFAQYISVHSSFHTTMTKQIFQYFTADVVEQEEEECGDIDSCQKQCLMRNKDQMVYRYQFMVGPDCHNQTGAFCGVCYKSTVFEKLARSPAFEPDVWKTYDFTSNEYPTWTESYWKSISGRMFLQPSPAIQHTTLAVGLTLTLLSLPLTYFLQKKSSIIFEDGASVTRATGSNTPAPVAL